MSVQFNITRLVISKKLFISILHDKYIICSQNNALLLITYSSKHRLPIQWFLT